jgi:hypothetical protein
MRTRKTADRTAAQTADNDVQASNINVIPLHGADSERTKQDISILKLRPVLQAVALTRDLIAERAQAIWLKRGCPRDRDEENWQEAEAQLKTELAVV